MSNFDLGNNLLIKWLLCCDRKKRKRLISKVQKQLTQLSVSRNSMRRAFQQLTQRTEVHLHKFTSEERRMYTQWKDNSNDGGYKNCPELCCRPKDSWPHYEEPLFSHESASSHNSCIFSQGYSERVSRERNGDVHCERRNYYNQGPQYSTSHHYRSASGERNIERCMRKKLYSKKRKAYYNDDSDGRRQKVFEGRKTIKSSVSTPISNFICENTKESEKVARETDEERLCGSEDYDSLSCLAIEINDTVVTSKTSNLGKQAHKAPPEKVVPCGTGKNSKVETDSNTKNKESRILVIVNGKVSDNTSGRVQEEKVTASIAQSTSVEGRKLPSSKRSFGTEQDEHHTSHKDLKSDVEVNPQKNTVEVKAHYHVFSEAALPTGLTPLVSEESVPLAGGAEETSDALNKSDGDVEKVHNSLNLDKAVPEERSQGSNVRANQWSTKRNCADIGQETKAISLGKLSHCISSENTERSTHTVKTLQTILSKEVDNYSFEKYEKAKHSSVLHWKSGCLKENTSVQKDTDHGSEAGDGKAKVAEVVETVADRPLGEFKPTENSQIPGDHRKATMHGHSEHAFLESSSQLKTKSQEHHMSIVTAEEIFHQSNKEKLMASEVKEIFCIDGIKYKASNGGRISNNKGQDVASESAIEKTLKGLSKYLPSKEKCGMNQIVPYNSFAGEAKKYQKDVPKYPGGVRRTSSQYYTTIGEYFGKNFIKRGREIEHNAKDSAKDLTKKESVSNNLLQLVCGNNFPNNLDKSDKVIKPKNMSTKTVILPAELKQKLVDVSEHQHRSKSMKRVKRRRSSPSDLHSKTHKKRRYSYGGEEAAVLGMSVEKGSKMRIVWNEKTKKNEDKILDIPELLEKERAGHHGQSTENATKTKSGGNEMLKTTVYERRLLGKENEVFSEIETVAVQCLPAKNDTKTKSEGCEIVKTGKSEEKFLKENAVCWKLEQQPVVEVVSVKKMKPVGSEIAKIRKNKKTIVRKKNPHLKGEEQAIARCESTKTSKMKPSRSGLGKIMKKAERLVKENLHSSIVDAQADTHLDLVKETYSRIAPTKAKSGGNEVKAMKSYVKVLRKQRQNEENTVEDIANRNPSHGPKLDPKFIKKKKKEIMLELFGEDPDEPSRENFNYPDGGSFKVLQKNNTCAVSATVSDAMDVNAAFASPFKLNHKEKGNSNKDYRFSAFCKSESRMKTFNKGTEGQSDHQKSEEFGGSQLNSLHHESKVKKTDSQKLTQPIVSLEQSNHHQGNVGSSIKDRESAPTIQHNNEDNSSLTFPRNDLHIAASKTVVVCADTLAENDHHKDIEPGGCETELPVTCSARDRAVVVTGSQNNRLKPAELHLDFETQESNVHLTGSITEGKNSVFHLIINMGNIDTLFPSPQKVQSGATMKQISVNHNVAEDTNNAPDGHASVKGFASAERCTEDPNKSLDTGENVEENINITVSDNAEVSTLFREAAESAMKHVQPVSDEVNDKESQSCNEHLTVESLSRSEPPQDLVLCGKESVQDSVSHSQNADLPETLTKQTDVEIAPIHAETASSQTLCNERAEEAEVKEGKETDRVIAHDKDIQKECDEVGKEKCVSESDCELNVDCDKEGGNFPQSNAHFNQSKSSASTLQTDISNSDCRPSVTSEEPSEQLGHSLTANPSQSKAGLSNSTSTNDIPHVADAAVSQILPRIRVRDPESLGITLPGSSFFEVMDKKLSDLTQFTYVLMQDMIRINERHKALSPLRGSLRDAETALVKAEWMSPHMTYKAISFLDLYKCVERSFPKQIEEFLIRRLNELNPIRMYTLEELERCLHCCKYIRNQNSSVPYPQQHQQQPVEVPTTSNVNWNTNNQILSLSQAGHISNSGANINSKQQTSKSVQNIASGTGVQFTAGRVEMGTHTSGSLTNVPPPSYADAIREVGTNFSARHSQIGNSYQQQFTIYNPAQTRRFSSEQCQTNSNSIPHMSVSATDGPIALTQGQVYNGPSENRTVAKIVQSTHGAHNTAQSAFQTLPAYHGNNNVAIGFMGHASVSGSSYSQPDSFSRPYPPIRQGAPYRNSYSSIYSQSQAIQPGTFLQHSSIDRIQNTSSSRVICESSQDTQQGMFPHIMGKNAVLNKSALKTLSQPYHQNQPIQQVPFSQSVRNVIPNISTTNSSCQLHPLTQQGEFPHRVRLPDISASVSSIQSYPQNETMQQGIYSQSVNKTLPNMPAPNSSSHLCPSAIQQGTFSDNLNNVAIPNRTRLSSHHYLPNQAMHQGIFSHHMYNNIPSQGNILLHGFLSAPAAGPGNVHQTRNYLYPPPPLGAPSSSLAQLTQMTLQVQQCVRAQECNVPASQENGGSYTRGSFPQQSRTLAVRPNSELQLHGAPLYVIQRQNSGRTNASNTESDSISYGRHSQNVPAQNGLFSRGRNCNGYFINGTRNSLSGKGNNQNESCTNSTSSNNLFYQRNTQSGQRSSSLSDGGNNNGGSLANTTPNNLSGTLAGSTSNCLSGRGNNQNGFLASNTASDTLSAKENSQRESLTNTTLSKTLPDRGNYKRGSLANTTPNNNLCDEGNSLSGTLAGSTSNCLSGRGNNQNEFLASNTASDTLSAKENSQRESLTNPTISKSLPDIGNSQSGPLPLTDIPTSAQFQTRLDGVHKQLSKSEDLPISEVVQQNMDNITLNNFSEAPNYTCIGSHVVNRRNVINGVCTVPEKTPLEDSQCEINSDITKSSASLQNSQTLLHGDKQSSHCGSQQRQLSYKVTIDQSEVSNSTVEVQASGSKNRASAVLGQSAGMLPSTSQSMEVSVYQPFGVYHRTYSGTVRELPEKIVSDPHITHNILSIETQQTASVKDMLQTHRRQSSNYKPRSQPDIGEVFGSRNEKVVEIESEGLGTQVSDSEDIQVVADIGGNKDKCDSHNYLHDTKTELSVVAKEEGNTTAEVTCKQSEQREITILTVVKCVPMPTSESSQTSSLDETSTITKEDKGSDKRESDSDVEVEILVEKSELQVTESMYHSEDKLLLDEDYEESKSLLEEESEDYKDSKLMMWFECEEEMPMWHDTEKTFQTWHESEVTAVSERMKFVIQCAVCEKAAKVKCSGCLITCYCSAECQLEDWNTAHHTVCCADLDG